MVILKLQKNWIREASESGFNCVKFQIYEPNEIVSPV